jgi:drug/metabolite transporter (DMT)-like permease
MVATLIFLPFWHRVPRPQYRGGDWKLLLLAAAFIPCLYYLLEGHALRYTTSGQAGVVSAVYPLLVSIGAWVFLKERLSRRGVTGIVISLAGVALLSLTSPTQEAASNPVLGNLLEFLAMLSGAGSAVAIKRLSARYSAWFLTGMQAAAGCAFFLPFALNSGSRGWMEASPSAWASVLYLGSLVSLGSWGLYNWALVRMPANKAALTVNLIPGVALLTGWALRGETVSPAQLGACALIVAAVVFAETDRDGTAGTAGPPRGEQPHSRDVPPTCEPPI